MPNSTSQVQHEKVEVLLQRILGSELLRKLGLSKEEKPHGRRYPHEDHGHYLTECLNLLSHLPAKQRSLLESVRVLQEVARAQKNRDAAAIDRLRKAKKGMNFAYGYLVEAALSGLREHTKNRWAIGLHDDGLIVEPTTSEARAAIGALLLEKNGRIDRIKRCLHCQSWFYARFKHQEFCRDLNKRCQWNHYHSPEWRRQHREQNKKHQRAYRDRIFGNRKRRS
jgi:hypothetical protein